MNNKAIIAMSGGVDSSVSAYLIKEQGFEGIGVTMKLFENDDIGINRENSCCSLSDVEDARSVAFKLGIPYYVFNFTTDFKSQVIERFINAYENGATPNPCIDCNRYLKFDKLYARAKELGCDYIVTGHYARIEYSEKYHRYLLKKAIDNTKDQSYVLYSMTQQQLAHTIFPLGELLKTQTRAIAEANVFVNAKKHDSQDICFVPDGDYAKFIENYTGKKYQSGNFIDRHGNIIGEHKGITRYTVGQRKGLGIAASKPMYVCSICKESNTVMLGDSYDLFSKSLDATGFNWISIENPAPPLRVKAKVRYKQNEQWATVTQILPDKVHIEFEEPQSAIANGQAVVLYDDDIVVGGGTIIASYH